MRLLLAADVETEYGNDSEAVAGHETTANEEKTVVAEQAE